jgi:hypothetical protein
LFARPSRFDIVAVTQGGHGISASWLFDHLEGSRKMKEEHLRQGLQYIQGSEWDERIRAEKGVKVCFLPSGPNIGEPRI